MMPDGEIRDSRGQIRDASGRMTESRPPAQEPFETNDLGSGICPLESTSWRFRVGTASPPGDELGRVDQGPEDVFERLATVADGLDVAAAGLDLLGGRLAGQHAEVQGVERRAVVGGGG